MINSNQKRICTKCKEEKDISDFHLRSKKSGLPVSECKSCKQKFNREWHHRNREEVTCGVCNVTFKRVNTRAFSGRCSKCWIKQHKAKAYIKSSEFFSAPRIRVWHKNALGRGLSWEVVEKDFDDLWIKQCGKCALSGLDMKLTPNNPMTVSLDRIDSTKGYAPQNIQLVGAVINSMKSDLKEDDFKFYCMAIANKLEKFHGKNE